MFLRKFSLAMAFIAATALTSNISGMQEHRSSSRRFAYVQPLKTRLLESAKKHTTTTNAVAFGIAALTAYVVHNKVMKGKTAQETAKRYAWLTGAAAATTVATTLASNTRNHTAAKHVAAIATGGRSSIDALVRGILTLPRTDLN